MVWKCRMSDHDPQTINRYASMRVRPVRRGVEGVTISGTEFVMTADEMAQLRTMLDQGIQRLVQAARDRADDRIDRRNSAEKRFMDGI